MYLVSESAPEAQITIADNIWFFGTFSQEGLYYLQRALQNRNWE